MVRHLRVIEGGKKKGGELLSGSGFRLFKAYSIGNLSKGDKIYHDVKFNWYCLERNHPVAPYHELISDYEHLAERRRRALEGDVKRYLTEQEVEFLENYLMERYGLNVSANEVPLPISKGDFFSDERKTIIYDFLELSEEDGYYLPFKVWGYYTVANCLTSPSLENGVLFLRKSLEYLGFTPGIDQNQLDAVVKALYDREGLYVKRKQT